MNYSNNLTVPCDRCFRHPRFSEMAPGKKCWGGKALRVPTAREASKIFTGHTFQIGLKCDYTLYKHNKQVTRVPTVHKNFQKFKCRRGGSVNFWGGLLPPPSTRGRPIPADSAINRHIKRLEVFLYLQFQFEFSDE